MVVPGISLLLCLIGLIHEKKKQTLDDVALVIYFSFISLNGFLLIVNPFQGKDMGLFGESFVYLIMVIILVPFIGLGFGLLMKLISRE